MLQIDTKKLLVAIANQCMTLEQAAEKAGIKRTSLSRLIKNSGSVRPDTIGKIAKALGKPVEEFLAS